MGASGEGGDKEDKGEGEDEEVASQLAHCQLSIAPAPEAPKAPEAPEAPKSP